MTNRKRKTVIIVLAVLLAISICALAGTLLYNHFAESAPASVTVPDNIITPDKSAAGDTLSGTLGTAAKADVSSDAGNNPDMGTGSNLDTAADMGNHAAANTNTASSAGAVHTTGAGTEAAAIYLYQKQPSDNEPFAVGNMFPGDTETRYYCVRVSHHNTVTVRFQTEIRQGSEKLAEVLKMRVVLLTTGETLYDGLMRDMPEDISHTLETDDSATSELYYEITAYLDTSVGNEYMEKGLAADFIWSVAETEHLEPPKTGDNSRILLWVVLLLLSFLMLFLLAEKRRKEEPDEA